MASAVPAELRVAAHWPVGSAVGSVSAMVAPRVATTVPSTSATAGRNASRTSRPMPTTASDGSAPATASMASNVLGSAALPKSRAWLLAIVTTSTPAAARAVSAVAGAWKVNRLPGSGRPPRPTDVSRLTMARSAAARVPVVETSAVAGSSSRPCSAPSK